MSTKHVINQFSKLDKSAKCTDKAFLDSMRRVVSSPKDVRDAKSSKRHKYFPRFRRKRKPMPKRNSKPMGNEKYLDWTASSTKYPSFEMKGGYCEVTVEIPCEEQNVVQPLEAESANSLVNVGETQSQNWIRSFLALLFPWRWGRNQKEPMIQINYPTFYLSYDNRSELYAPVEQVAEKMLNNNKKVK